MTMERRAAIPDTPLVGMGFPPIFVNINILFQFLEKALLNSPVMSEFQFYLEIVVSCAFAKANA